MKLINTNTKKQMIVGKSYHLVKGENEGKTVKISALVEPCEANPKGFVDVDKTGITFQRYYPEVLGAEFIDDVDPKTEAIDAPLPVPVLPANQELSVPPIEIIEGAAL